MLKKEKKHTLGLKDFYVQRKRGVVSPEKVKEGAGLISKLHISAKVEGGYINIEYADIYVFICHRVRQRPDPSHLQWSCTFLSQ